MHRKDGVFHLRFESNGDFPRIFTEVMANAYNAKGMIGSEMNGIAILDNGSEEYPGAYVLMDGIGRGDKAAQRRIFEELKTMDWASFKTFVRENEQHTRAICDDVDADAEHPDAGDAKTYLPIGLIDISDEPDLRTDEMKAIDADADLELTFPALGRNGILKELLDHA